MCTECANFTNLSYIGNLFNIYRLDVAKLGLICPLCTLYTQQNKMHKTYKKRFCLKMSKHKHAHVLPFAILSLPPPSSHRTKIHDNILLRGGYTIPSPRRLFPMNFKQKDIYKAVFYYFYI